MSTIEELADDALRFSGGRRMRPIEETLAGLADRIEAMHGADSDWWKGYVLGIRRAASLVEVHQAFEYGESCGE